MAQHDPSPDDAADIRVKVVVVGAGLSGIAAAAKLRAAGITDFVVLEKASRVGGVWRENTYPGCGVDIPSPVYSFSFNPNPSWRSNFARQPELLDYIEDTVDKFDLAPWIRTDTEMIEARWSTGFRRWILDTTAGRYTAQYVIFAAGPITDPKTPDVPGIADFPGDIFHSARWNHDVDLTGKRVAVVGTGASAVQFIPEIAPIVDELTVFQRTPSWVVPRLDFTFPAAAHTLFSRAPVVQRALRNGIDVILRSLTLAMRRERIKAWMALAQRISSSVDAPRWVPRSICLDTASAMAGWECPSKSAPCPDT